MDENKATVIVCLITVVGVVVAIAGMSYASIANTHLRTEAVVAKAQEHTKRVETRQQNLDLLGFFRGWKDR